MNTLVQTVFKNDEGNAGNHSIPAIQIHHLDSMYESRSFQSNAPERLKVFEIIWVKKGSGTLNVDLQKFCISENMIYCLIPGQYRTLQFSGAIEGYYISLTSEFLYLTESHIDFTFLRAQYIMDWVLPIVQSDNEMESLIVRMHREFQDKHFLRFEILKGLLKVFMISLSRSIENRSQNNKRLFFDKDVEIVRRFMGLLKKHFASKKFVADYADELCITPNYLNSVVKKLTGFPVSHHIQQYIVMEAKRQAMYSSLRMKEVADNLGFDDYAHFSKFFKNYSGVNFSSFKKDMQRNYL
jgi:AraC family transcriptional activator of pobA